MTGGQRLAATEQTESHNCARTAIARSPPRRCHRLLFHRLLFHRRLSRRLPHRRLLCRRPSQTNATAGTCAQVLGPRNLAAAGTSRATAFIGARRSRPLCRRRSCTAATQRRAAVRQTRTAHRHQGSASTPARSSHRRLHRRRHRRLTVPPLALFAIRSAARVTLAASGPH